MADFTPAPSRPRETPTVYYDEEPYSDFLSDLEEDVWLLVRSIRDPEFPYTLSQLRVVSPAGVSVDSSTSTVRISFSPTVPHCSMATLIGLCIRTKLEQEFGGPNWKYEIQVKPGTHEHADQISKQLLDKERVSAAMENPNLMRLVETAIAPSN